MRKRTSKLLEIVSNPFVIFIKNILKTKANQTKYIRLLKNQNPNWLIIEDILFFLNVIVIKYELDQPLFI